MLSPLVRALITSLPTLLVAAAGLIVAVVMLQRSAAAALLACGGCLLTLGYDAMGIASPILFKRLESFQVPGPQIDTIDLVYFLVDDLILAVGVVLLVAAAFVGRRRGTGDRSRPGDRPQGQPPYQGQPPKP